MTPRQLPLKQVPQHGVLPQRAHASHVPVVLHLLPLQQGMVVELQVYPALRHRHCPLIQPRPEQHWLDEVQLVPDSWHASHCPPSQTRPWQQGASAPQVLLWLTQSHSPE